MPRGGPRDIAWQHGVSIDKGTKSLCNYCEKIMQSGGATRLKQHLAGGFINVEQCLHCPPQVRSIMVRLLKRSEENRLEKERVKVAFQAVTERLPKGGQHVDDDDDDDEEEEENKDPKVQHLQDASTGGGSAEIRDTTSAGINIKSCIGSSDTMIPRFGVEKYKDPEVLHTLHANVFVSALASTLSPWMDPSSHEVGGGSTQSGHLSQDIGDNSSDGINLKSSIECSNNVKPKCSLKKYRGLSTDKEDQVGFHVVSERPLKGGQHVGDNKDKEKVKDPEVQHLRDANRIRESEDQLRSIASCGSKCRGQSSHEVGNGSTQSDRSSQNVGDNSSGSINIESYSGCSDTEKPKCGVNKYRGSWTAELDQAYIEQYGDDNWRAPPEQYGLLRSCTSNFTKEEEDTIIKMHKMLQKNNVSYESRWSTIVEKLPGRTEDEIEDVWFTSLRNRPILDQAILHAPQHLTELSKCEANMSKELKHMQKTDGVNLQSAISSISAMSGSDIGSVSNVGSIPGMDETKDWWDTFKEFTEWSEMQASDICSVSIMGLVSDVGSVSDMDENKDFWGTFKEFSDWQNINLWDSYMDFPSS